MVLKTTSMKVVQGTKGNVNEAEAQLYRVIDRRNSNSQALGFHPSSAIVITSHSSH